MLSDTLILDPMRGALLGALNGKFWPFWKKLPDDAADLSEHIEKLQILEIFHEIHSSFYTQFKLMVIRRADAHSGPARLSIFERYGYR